MATSLFDTDGLVVARKAFSATACNALDLLLAQFDMDAVPDAGIRFARGCADKNPEILQLIRESDAVRPFADGVVLYDELIEARDTPRAYPVHQDGAYFPTANASLYLALSDLTAERGGLAVLPGSHAGGLRRHADRGFGPSIESDRTDQLDKLELKRGDAVLLHPLLVHELIGNRGPDKARMYSAIFGEIAQS